MGMRGKFNTKVDTLGSNQALRIPALRPRELKVQCKTYIVREMGGYAVSGHCESALQSHPAAGMFRNWTPPPYMI